MRRRRAEAAADSRSTPKTVLRGSVRGGVRPGRERGRRGTRLGGPGGAAVAGGGRSAARGGAAASVRNRRRDRARERGEGVWGFLTTSPSSGDERTAKRHGGAADRWRRRSAAERGASTWGGKGRVEGSSAGFIEGGRGWCSRERGRDGELDGRQSRQ